MCTNTSSTASSSTCELRDTARTSVHPKRPSRRFGPSSSAVMPSRRDECDTHEVGQEEQLVEDAEDLYENAPIAYFTSRLDGTLVRVNETLLRWTGYAREDLIGRKRLHDLLPAGARIYYETHYAPLLRMQ